MKRVTIILASLLAVAIPMMAERVTPETARKVATTFLNNNGAKTAQLTDLSKEAGFPNLYIFTGEEGFVVMAADDCVKPILGYSLTDIFVVNNMPENMREWLQGYSDEIQFAIEHKLTSSIEVKQQWTDLCEGKPNVAKATSVVDALIETTWDQSPRYNNMCPYDSNAGARTVTGCVATAMAQILKFWGTDPTPGIGSHSYIHETYGLQSADFGSTIYNWGNMPLSLSSSSTPEQINEVARLMYHCGVSVDMDYGLSSTYGGNGSAAYSQSIPSALINYFNYSTTAKHVDKYSDNEEWKTLLKNELDARRPMAYHGSGSGGGHAFICDGYNSDDYFHFNWGWNGSYNNIFYTLDDLTPGSHNYNNDQGAVIGIQPAPIGQAVAPTLEVIAVQEPGVRNAQLTWNEVENATAYRIYRNNNLIDSISSGDETTHTYIDEHIAYGTTTYFIRSVDENRYLSWPSNYASLTLTFSAPTNLEAGQTEDGVALSWLAGENAVSYNIYCNNVLIGSNINATSYTDTRIIAGILSYFVKGVDTFGDESEASEAAEITIPYSTPVVNDLSASLSEDNAALSWTAPQWCYPSESSATLTYGNQVSVGASFFWEDRSMFWGHRHLAENISAHIGKKLYKVSFQTNYPGIYELRIYKGSTTSSNGSIVPIEGVATQTILVTDVGWNEIDLSSPIEIEGGQDLWVFMHNPETIENLKSFLCSASGSYGLYYTNDPTSSTNNNIQGYAFLIKAFLTDGTYTYNLYQDGVSIATNLSGTTYSNVSFNNNAANIFTVKTNYYGSETEDSNIVGLAKGAASLNSLEMTSNDKMTVTENSKLTVSGTLSNNVADNLILENGAQLIHNSANVQATVKKTIAPYTANDNGWNFIASPVTENTIPSESNGFFNGTPGQNNNTYDLYYYDEPNQLWKNYENQSFVIENKKGYLYANGETNGTILKFAGTLSPSNESITINNLSHSATTLNGFNLVGNPFACNATINQDCYVIEGNQVILANGTKVFAPCEGAFMKATSSNNYAVTFSKYSEAKAFGKDNCLDLVVTQGKATTDRARVRFGEGIGLEKFSLDDQHSQISLSQDGQEYAVAYTDGTSEMPVNFMAAQDGTYTLNIENKNLALDYLHLIDNMTGDDVDLLTTPSYTFEAKYSDYPSRFRLVFASEEDGASTSSATFAYYANGEIIITGITDTCDASIQIVDMTGRVIVSHNGYIQCVPTTGMTSGVYVLRLINGDNVKTQKIVIE